MKYWFMAGGWSMFVILGFGIAALVVGALAIKDPTKARLGKLRSLLTLTMLSALFGFGTNLWAVNVHLQDSAFVQAQSITGDQLPFAALIGFTEAAQSLSLGALMALLGVILHMIAKSRAAKNGATT